MPRGCVRRIVVLAVLCISCDRQHNISTTVPTFVWRVLIHRRGVPPVVSPPLMPAARAQCGRETAPNVATRLRNLAACDRSRATPYCRQTAAVPAGPAVPTAPPASEAVATEKPQPIAPERPRRRCLWHWPSGSSTSFGAQPTWQSASSWWICRLSPRWVGASVARGAAAVRIARRLAGMGLVAAVAVVVSSERNSETGGFRPTMRARLRAALSSGLCRQRSGPRGHRLRRCGHVPSRPPDRRSPPSRGDAR